ncbi:TPA: hypothetical protein ACH3X1_009946 [Trebouxia sp. C0004]
MAHEDSPPHLMLPNVSLSPVCIPGPRYKAVIQTCPLRHKVPWYAEGGFGRNLQVRLVRTVAFGMILVAATKVVPLMFQSTVPHAVGLCDAKEPIMQKAAASRVSRLAESDASLKELVDAGVVHKLLAMLKPEVDEGVADAVLCAIKELSRLPEGREALKSAGATAVLAEAVEQQWLQGEHSNTQATKIRNWLTVR